MTLLKISVGTALLTSTFLAGNLIIFGTLNDQMIAVASFILALITSALSIHLLGWKINTFKGITTILIIGMLFSSATAFSMTATKSYVDSKNALDTTGKNLQNEISFATQKINYYTQYADYFKTEIGKYQSNSANLDAQITALAGEINLPAPAQIPQESAIAPVIQTQPTITRSSRERDDDWEEDDD